MSNNTVKTIKFDMTKLAADHGQAVRGKLSQIISVVQTKKGATQVNAVLDMLDWAHAYPEYVLDWAGYKPAQSNTNQNSNEKESEMKTEKVVEAVEVIDMEVVEVETVVADEVTGNATAADYQEFLEYQEFRAWKAQQERKKFAQRPIDQTPPRIENKVVFATPARREPEVKFVSPQDLMKAQAFIKKNVAKTVHEVEKSYFMSCEWHGTERIAEDVTVDLSGLMQPVTEERGLAIAKAAFDGALERAMYDRFGSNWEYQLESAGVISPLKVSRIVGAVMAML